MVDHVIEEQGIEDFSISKDELAGFRGGVEGVADRNVGDDRRPCTLFALRGRRTHPLLRNPLLRRLTYLIRVSHDT